MLKVIYGYFNAVWNDYEYTTDNRIEIWFSRLWGILVSPLIILIILPIWACVKIAEFINK